MNFPGIFSSAAVAASIVGFIVLLYRTWKTEPGKEKPDWTSSTGIFGTFFFVLLLILLAQKWLERNAEMQLIERETEYVYDYILEKPATFEDLKSERDGLSREMLWDILDRLVSQKQILSNRLPTIINSSDAILIRLFTAPRLN